MRPSFTFAFLLILFLSLLFWYIIAHSFYDVQIDTQKSFLSDGCTLFPEGNWSACCVQHDVYYWQGGSAQKRREADRELQECFYNQTDNQILALFVYSGVRVGGVPYIKTPWRWGFGWEYGRGYR